MKKIILTIILFLFFVSNVNAETLYFDVKSGGDDGYAIAAGHATYPPSGADIVDTTTNLLYLSNRYNSPGYYLGTGLLRFDTSAIPDTAAVTSATLHLYVSAVTNADGKTYRGSYYSFSTIQLSDWAVDPGATAFSISTVTGGATSEITLSNLTSISKTGYTGFRIGFSPGQPTGANQWDVGSYESNTHIPRLTVTYSTGYAHEINGVANSPEINGVANPTEVNGL